MIFLFPTLFLSLTLSNPIFLPPAYSPVLIYFWRERGWWITYNYQLLFILGGKEVGGLLIIISSYLFWAGKRLVDYL
jgi:hypothetical protein